VRKGERGTGTGNGKGKIVGGQKRERNEREGESDGKVTRSAQPKRTLQVPLTCVTGKERRVRMQESS